MEYRQLGRSGLNVSVLSLGTMTFGGKGNFGKTGATGVDGARRQVDLCLEAGINLIDTADIYSMGLAEEILGNALIRRKHRMIAGQLHPGARHQGGQTGRCDQAPGAYL
jgi:aryl-alcohol dehydrogenase-like predicted oxidoreductase